MYKKARRPTASCAVALLLALQPIPSPAADNELLVLVASNARNAFTVIITDFERRHRGVRVNVQYLGGTQIGDLIDQQAPLDVVLVGRDTTDREAALLTASQAVWRNREVILVPKGNPQHIRSLKDLGNPGMTVAVGSSTSAVGKLASKLIQNAAAKFGFSFVKNVRRNISIQAERGSDVVDALASGRADAAIAFASDRDDSRYTTVPIGGDFNVISTYEIAVAKNARHPALAQALVQTVAGADGQAVLHRFNFMSPL